MKKRNLSGPAVFMYSTILLTVLVSLVCFWLYYSGVHKNSVILWVGIVSFMILYHFGMRIFMGSEERGCLERQNVFMFHEL
jgi:hypothetical protein